MRNQFESLVCDRCERETPEENLQPVSAIVAGEMVLDMEEVCPRCRTTLLSKLAGWKNYVRRAPKPKTE